jgi:hypothetical protein
MFDHKKALELGYIVHCVASLVEPVTVSGQYRCTEGHAHFVSWRNREVRVSPHGYQWNFLAAVDAADDAATAAYHPEKEDYARIYNEVLTAHGFAAVILAYA